MKRYTDLEYLRLSKWEKFRYSFLSFFAGIPQALKNAGIGIGRFFAKIGKFLVSAQFCRAIQLFVFVDLS